MEERRLGPVVGLGTWNTFRDDALLAAALAGAALALENAAAGEPPWFGREERAFVEGLAR